jgi:endonuclease/exonuclease/phosphatase family metal-dependent hydrolase
MRQQSATRLSVLTLNVWGLRIGPWSIARNVDNRILLIGRHLQQLNPDVVALQEVWCDRIAAHLIKANAYRYYAYKPMRRFFKGRLGNGLLMLSRLPITEEYTHPFTTHTCPDEFFANKGYQLVQVETPCGFIHIANTHLGAGKRPADVMRRIRQLEELLTGVGSLSRRHPVIMAGDFNMNENSPEYSYLRSWMNDRWDDECDDTFRRRHPEVSGHTFFVNRSYTKKPSIHDRDERIDFIFSLTSKRSRMSLSISDSRVVMDDPEELVSDHAGLMTTIELKRRATIDEILPTTVPELEDVPIA